MRSRAGGWQGSLLHQPVVGGVVIERVANEPLRTLRLSPIQTYVSQIRLEGHRNVGWHGNRAGVGNQALQSKLIERVELGEAIRTVVDAGVLVHHLKARVNPKLVLDDGAADGADIVLPREGLLGFGRRVLNGKTRIQRCSAFEDREVAMPVIGAAVGADDDGACGRASDVGILGRGLHRKFTNDVRRKVLQEAADIVVGVVDAIDGQLIVQPGTATGGHRGNARLGGIGRLYRLGSRNHVGDVGKAACRQRNGLQVFAGDDAAVDCIGGVERLGGDGGCLPFHSDSLCHRPRSQRNQ